MPIYSEEDINDWSKERRQEIHEWCFYHDYGDCNKCALNPPETRFEQVEENDK